MFCFIKNTYGILWKRKCFHFILKFEMQEAGWGSLTDCKVAPALPFTCLYPRLDLRDLGRGDQPATFLAQLIIETSPLLTLPLISNLWIVGLLEFFCLISHFMEILYSAEVTQYFCKCEHSTNSLQTSLEINVIKIIRERDFMALLSKLF